MSTLNSKYKSDSSYANNPSYSGVNKVRLTAPTVAKLSPDITFKASNLPKVSSLSGALKSLPIVGTALLFADSLADSVNLDYTKKLLQNLSWKPDSSFSSAYPELSDYANVVIKNREVENARLNLEQQKKEYDANLAGYIDHLGGVENISADDMANLTRGTLENYPELKGVIGDKIPPYSDPEPILPTNSIGEPYAVIPPSPSIPIAPIAPIAPIPPKTAKTLLSVLENNNKILIDAMNIHNNRVVLALKGVPDTPLSTPFTSEPLSPNPLEPDSMPTVGLPYKDENGVYMVLGQDGVTRMTTKSQSGYNHVDYNSDINKLMSAKLSPRPELGLESVFGAFSPEYLAEVKKQQDKYDAEFGTPEQLKNIMNKYNINDDAIKQSFQKAKIPFPSGNVVPETAPSSYTNVINNITIEKTVQEKSLIDLQISALNFDNTPLDINDMGDTIPLLTPQEMRAVKNAHVAKKNSDENTFEVDDFELDDMFGMPDISAIFGRTSKIDRWQGALTDYKNSL